MSTKPIQQHDREIHQNAVSWSRKPLLRKVYNAFYKQIDGHLAPPQLGPRLELGSGIGAIKDAIPDCITSDIFPNPWLDRAENAYALSFGSESLGSIILLDVWHHLQFPGTALDEFHRVLRPGGRLVIVDPAAGSLLGRIIYGSFHHEPLGLGGKISWYAPDDFNPAHQSYYAAQANCWRMFRGRTMPAEIRGWALGAVELDPAFTYVASGGFSGPQLYPAGCFPLLKAFEQIFRIAPSVFATRMFVVLERLPTPAPF